jgi:predicted  nucleic acid-binding Zn-ribbon protein
MSRAHPGESYEYNKKKEVRERRNLHRELHKEALKEYERLFSNTKSKNRT